MVYKHDLICIEYNWTPTGLFLTTNIFIITIQGKPVITDPPRGDSTPFHNPPFCNTPLDIATKKNYLACSYDGGNL